MHILLDNGHGIDTPGKRSPDGTLREYLWTRTLARTLASRLTDAGHRTTLLVPEQTDIPLATRVARANALDADLLISLHVNAAGNGTAWHRASGFSVFVAPRASTAARRYAASLWTHAAAAGLAGNRSIPPGTTSPHLIIY